MAYVSSAKVTTSFYSVLRGVIIKFDELTST